MKSLLLNENDLDFLRSHSYPLKDPLISGRSNPAPSGKNLATSGLLAGSQLAIGNFCPNGDPHWNPVFLGPCSAVPLFCPLLASKGLILSPGLTALGPALAPCYGQRGGQDRGWQIKTKCRSCSKQLLEEEPTAGSTGLGASFMSPCLIPSKTHKPYLQGCWGEGKPLGPDWGSLVGDQADSQMKFFRLETILQFLGRLWSQGTTTSIMAREEHEGV